VARRAQVPRARGENPHLGATNPLSIEAQCQGAIGFGLTRPPYVSDATAAIDVHIIPSNDAPFPINCFMDIQSGSGGTEAQDWAAMLERMYAKYRDRKG